MYFQTNVYQNGRVYQNFPFVIFSKILFKIKPQIAAKKIKKMFSKMLFFAINFLFFLASSFGMRLAKNPILTPDDKSYPDPWVVLANDIYWHCGSEDSARLYITFAPNLPDILNQPKHYIYTPPPGQAYSEEVWAPELHFLDNHWYVYFAADDGRNENHRMFVLEGGTDPLDPLNGVYKLKGKLAPPTDHWAIDGSPFLLDSTLYYLWSGWPGLTNVMKCIYISSMSNPYTLSSDRIEISCPVEPWELNGFPYINEGPQVLISNRTVNIVYSASGSWTDDYCLGVLSCSTGNVMDKSCWSKRGPALIKHDKVYGIGHASFVKSKDRLQNWIVYHAAKYQGGGWDRNVRIQTFTYHEDVPYFGAPVQPGVFLTINPSMTLIDGVYRIKSKFNNFDLTILGDSLQDTAAVVTSSVNASACNRWEFTYQPLSGYYKIKAICSNKMLDNAGASLVAGNKLIQYRENGNDAQLWRLENMDNGYFKISNKRSLLYLDVPGYNNIPVIQWYATNDDSQLFTLY
jgi:GH43 family beta-xylosidase